MLAPAYSKGLSSQFSRAKGTATLDLKDGSLTVEVSGLPEGKGFDVWLVDNRPGPKASVKPEGGDGFLRVGRLRPEAGKASLGTVLEADIVKGFKLDLVVVAEANGTASDAGWLYGTPTLFQRLYYGEERASVDRAARGTGPLMALAKAPFQMLIPAPAYAQTTPDLEALIAEGERLFFGETFGGNGRTCGTCHRAENNLTIDPAFIATLPPRDPLFVAEFNPALKDLEKPRLMRRFGLILENVDGLEDPTKKFVMRGVPHTLALTHSLTQPTNLPGAPPEMTGWSGDGSPGGTLRDFAMGAVTQHFTRSLNRVPGTDFQLPTPEQLDAMEAFQLSTGRQDDLNLDTLVLADPDLVGPNEADQGRLIFRDGTSGGDPTLPGGKCATCHRNAGALNTPNDENRNFNTGIEDRADSPTLAPGIPRDGGFGVAPNTCDVNSVGIESLGDGRFNSVVLVEAADTTPLFHNHVAKTIEEAVEHYNRREFNNNPCNQRAISGQIQMSPAQVTAVATFLRVINADGNVRSASELAQTALGRTPLASARPPLRLAIADTTDGIRVLLEKGLHPGAAAALREARRLLDRAGDTASNVRRDALIRLAIAALNSAHDTMVL
ncbi:MAG: hypothetical protein ACT4QB_02405 [Gammaproteobacteria bacterium]